jgi:hypothetical protein
MPFVSALPLRLPIMPQNENGMAGMLAAWMDHSPGWGISSNSDSDAEDCRKDLKRIDRLRKDIAHSLSSMSMSGGVVSLKDDERSEESQSESQWLSEIIETLHEYYHLLSECEGHGMVQNGGGGESSSPSPPSCEFVSLSWKSSIVTTTSGQQSLQFQFQTADSLESERANVMWNLAALEAHLASKENLSTKVGWNKASKRLQNAASWLAHLLELLQQQSKQQQYTYTDMSPAFVSFWQALLLAQAQHCVYEATCVKRPMQLLAAKLAAEAVTLYGEVERIVKNDETEHENEYKHETSPEISIPTTLSQCSDLVPKLVLFARAWGTYMSCKAEYHQSQIHREKKAWGQELARLDVAYQHAAICKTLCEDDEESPAIVLLVVSPQMQEILDELRTAVDETLELVKSRMDTAERENNEQHKQTIPAQQELTGIRGQKIVGCGKPLSELLQPKTTKPIFQGRNNRNTNKTNAPAASAIDVAAAPLSAKASTVHTGSNHYNHVVTNTNNTTNTLLPTKGTTPPLPSSTAASSSLLLPSAHLKTYVEVFKVEMNEIIEDLARATEDQTESARLALAEVHLPASLTVYNQEQSGGGLPEDLWQRVHVIQQDYKIMRLKQDLWELKDAAELARATHEKITTQLEFDTNSDQQFREANAGFEGHDADEVQRSFRKPLTSYYRLLSSAQEGDSVLFRRLKQLDIEPKYDLLQFSKSQLDRLLPGARGRRQDGNDHDSDMVANTQHLSYLLGELKALFQERANLMALIRKEFKNFDVLGALKAKVDPIRGTDQDYLDATKHAQKAFDGIRYEIQTNVERQNELLGTILAENERFMNARMRTTTSQSADSCIVMIEDAIEEIDQLSKHLKEGKAFYNLVLPKLDVLKHQVDDVSARLAVERLEHGEREKKKRQERKDALMAKTLFSNESSSSPSARTESGAASSSAAARAPASYPVTTPDASAAATAARGRSQSGVAGRTVGGVDDEKVAILVAMEFDADKVVAALEKHNNNVDKALNELLSC